jgi:hypothetical protein
VPGQGRGPIYPIYFLLKITYLAEKSTGNYIFIVITRKPY